MATVEELVGVENERENLADFTLPHLEKIPQWESHFQLFRLKG